MGRLSSQMDQKSYRQMKTRLSGVIAVILGLPCSMFAQDSLLVDSMPPYPTLRVRSIVEAHVVDSLWSDSVWVWNGACEGPARSFRFEFPDSTFCAVEVPCTRIPPPATSMPLSSESSPYPTETWTSRQPSRWSPGGPRRTPLVSSCFPPAGSAAFDALLSAMEQAVFETESARYWNERV